MQPCTLHPCTLGALHCAAHGPQPASRTREGRRYACLPAVRAGVAIASRVHAQSDRHRRALRPAVRSLDGLPGAARGPDRERLDPDRGPRHLGPQAPRGVDHPREQHRADDWLGGRIGGGGRRLHRPGADLPRAAWPRLLRVLPDHDAGVCRRHPRGVDDGAAAPGADRQRAWAAALSRRHCVRRCARVGRARRARWRRPCSRALRSARSGRRSRGSSSSSARLWATACLAARSFQTPRSTSTSRRNTWASATSIGPRIAGVMFAGGVLSWLVLLPLFTILGEFIDRAVPSDSGEWPEAVGDDAQPDVERLHPLHGRGRRARSRHHHARADHPDHHLVVSRQHARPRCGHCRRCSASGPSATCR